VPELGQAHDSETFLGSRSKDEPDIQVELGLAKKD